MKGPTLEVSGSAAEVVASDGGVTLNIPIALRRRSGRRVVVPEGPGFESEQRTRIGVTPLQLALARGHRWLRMLEAGDAASMSEIARREGTDHSYIARHINLTLLAPDIVAAILDEELPDGVRLHGLSINPPALWDKQRRALYPESNDVG
ncbi:LacI family transcriptional regulator [Sphingomonas sp.]|uniref:LacI family transcriptional regulator n=1 Tax=Sphingomonas sp. TaxID=28214 RepID=UPI0035AE3B9C